MDRTHTYFEILSKWGFRELSPHINTRAPIYRCWKDCLRLVCALMSTLRADFKFQKTLKPTLPFNAVLSVCVCVGGCSSNPFTDKTLKGKLWRGVFSFLVCTLFRNQGDLQQQLTAHLCHDKPLCFSFWGVGGILTIEDNDHMYHTHCDCVKPWIFSYGLSYLSSLSKGLKSFTNRREDFINDCYDIVILPQLYSYTKLLYLR